jgi:UDP-N-acetylglucosamine--N-acetylmuramyl-(pentapeptide) pyrophosphoryl-undecaprenol N-acetylglucosamine transferase
MNKDLKKRRLLIAGGGTGGHLFPGVAVAETFLSRSPDHGVLFVNTARPLDQKILGSKGLPFAPISASGLKGQGLWQSLLSLMRLPRAFGEAFAILRAFKPHALLSVGGYAAAPAALAAKCMGIPLILHEQNKLPGLTTRLLSRLAEEVHVSFPHTPLPVSPERIRVTGNPVRSNLVQCRKRRRRPQDPLNLLILGGSQGARGLNRVVCQALPRLGSLPLSLTHQTGAADLQWVEEAYAASGIKARIQPFIEDMESCYREADLVLCRAGATTVAELAAAGLGAIFIPFPHAADNHQYYNAKALSDIQAAVILEEKNLTPETLTHILTTYVEHPEITEAMASAALTLSRPHAAIHLTEALMARMPEVN